MSQVRTGLFALAFVMSAGVTTHAEPLVVVNAEGSEVGAKRIAQLRADLKAYGHVLPSVEDQRLLEGPLPPAGAIDRVAANNLRKKAFERFSSFKYKKARSLLAKAEAILLESADATFPAVELGEIALLRGQVAFQQGNASDAAGQFRLARRLMRRDKLDAGFYSPKVRGAYAAAAKAKSTTLRIGSNAKVGVDGQPILGRSATLLTGPHYVTIAAPGSRPVVRLVEFGSDVHELDVSLEPLSRAEQIVELRRALVDAPTDASTDDATTLSNLLGTDRLLVVAGESSSLQLTLFTKTMSGWSTLVAATPSGLRTLMANPVLAPEKVVRPTLLEDAKPHGADLSRSWTSRNRGKLVIGGVVLVAVAVATTVVILTAESGARIDNVCGIQIPCD